MKNIEQALLEEKTARKEAEIILVLKQQQLDEALKELETLKQNIHTEVEKKSADLESIALFAVQYPEPLIRINYAGEVLVKNVAALKLNTIFFHNRYYQLRDFLKLIATVVRRKKIEWKLEAMVGDVLYSFLCQAHHKNDYINIYGKDITHERKAQEEMQRLSLVASANENGVIFTDAGGKIFWTNEGFLKLTGFNTANAFGKTLDELCSSSNTSNSITDFHKEGRLFCTEAVFKRLDGSRFWGRCSGQPIKKNNNAPLEYFLVIENITLEKEQEEKLRRREEKYRSIIASMRMGLVEFDKNGHMCFVNNSFCEMTGYEVQELIGNDMVCLLATEASEQKLRKELLSTRQGLSSTFESAVVTKAGNLRWWLLCSAPLYNDEGKLTGSIAVSLDITAQKELEHQLRESKIEAEHSAKAKEIFLANVSHEIRTPMNAVLGMSKLLQKTSLQKEQKLFASTIQKAAGNLLVIINDILDFSKIEAGKITLESIGFELKELLQQAVFSMAHKAEEKGLYISLHIDEKVEHVLLGDPFRINQILMNLLSNAIKFTEKGNVQVRCMLQANHIDKQDLLIQVIDSGVGIDDAFQQHLFEKFTQEDGSIARRYGGTGLGMSICKQLVEMMHGTIQVNSQKNKGTTISISLSLQKGAESSLRTIETRPININLLKDKRILLAEDNELNRLLVKAMLQNYGIKITEAVNGLETIAKLQHTHFDLVLMDVQMPEMDGLEATRMIRGTLNKSIPIIALTANAIQTELERCLRAGMNGYLTKPFEEDDLLQIVAKWIANQEELELSSENLKSDQPLYDLTHLYAISRGNTDFVKKMIVVFLKEIPATVTGIRNAYEEADLKKIKSLAHRIKASLDNMGIIMLSEDIRRIEKYAEDDKAAELAPLIHKMEMVINRVVIQLERELEMTSVSR